MPSITIDQKHCPIHTDNLRTNGELIPKLREEFLKSGESLSCVHVNNINYKPGSDEGLNSIELTEGLNIDFKVQHNQSVAYDALDSLPSFLERLNDDIYNSLKKLGSDKCQLHKTIEKVDLFIQLINNIHKVLNFGTNSKSQVGFTIKELQVHLLFVVKAINNAYKSKDFLMLSDLLEYELVDNLTQWKIMALPQIKKLNSI